LLEFIPGRIRNAALITMTSLAVGFQFLTANEYRNDWAAHKDFFWQMKWRAPGMAESTLIFTNEELAFYADNSLASALNWMYAPQQQSDELAYALMYPLNRLGGSLPSLESGVPIEYDYLVGKFEGNTSRSLAFYYDPPGCLRLLDAEIDPFNRFIPADSLMREAAGLSDTALILSESTTQLPDIYFPEPMHGWCYYFERADLARQMQDWRLVAEMGESAFALDDHPNDPIERFVFIEGFAHLGEWEKAEKYSEDSYRVSKEFIGPLLCRLWQRIEADTPESDKRAGILQQVKTNYACNW